MRKIKFRGKRIDNGEWVYGDLVAGRIAVPNEIDTGDHYENWKDVYSFHKVLPETVGQYIEINDKNGVEIYEGSILRVLQSDWISKSEKDPRTLKQYLIDIALIYIVIHSFNGFYISRSLNGYAESIQVGNHGYLEVIGDVHDHKYLIKNI